MKILFLTTNEPDKNLQTIIDQTQKEHTVKIINLKNNNNYVEIVDAIEDSERVISW